MAFRQCFLRPPELTKIVLPKVLQNSEDPKMYLLAQGTEPKRFPKRDERVPFNFLEFCNRMDVEKSQRSSLSVFSAL